MRHAEKLWGDEYNPRRSGRRQSSLGLEEIAQDCPAFRLENSASHLRLVIELRMSEQVAYRTGHPRLGVPRAKHHALESSQYDRTRAHRARLERDVQRAVVEPPAIQLQCRF